MHTIERIKKFQKKLAETHAKQLSLDTPARHEPEILLIGCVDARLDIIGDLGIPKGKALIYRNIAALVQGSNEGDIAHKSEAAALEFAVEVMKVRTIIVMGHTDCGGIAACLAGIDEHPAIQRYLSSLDEVRSHVVEQGGNATAQARAMEEAAVRKSIENLLSYDVVRYAIQQQELKIHGWLINTANGLIREMDAETGEFRELSAD